MRRTSRRGTRHRSHRAGHVLALALAVGAALASCGEGGGGAGSGTTPSTDATPVERPSSTAELSIVSPENGAVVRGSTVDLRVRLEGGTIVPQTTTDLRPDEGHLHVILDEELISMTEGLAQTIEGVSPGMHRLTIEFVAADHAPFDPRVVAIVAFEVRS